MSIAAVCMTQDLDSRNEIEARRRYHRELFDEAWGKFLAISRGSPLRAQNLKQFALGLKSGRGTIQGRERMILWVVDFQIAGLEILKGNELRIWSLYFIGQLSKRETAKLVGVDHGAPFQDLAASVKERVGSEIERRRLWPLRNQSGSGYLD